MSHVAPHSALNTKLTRMTGCQYPIIQSAMGWVATGPLCAATANAGAMGFIGSATMDLQQLAEEIAWVKDHTDKPFGVNMRSDAPDANERVQLMIKSGVKFAGFALAPKEKLIKTLKDAGIVCIPSIGAKRHAEKVASWGADALIVQGGEGGGHTGSIATTILLPQIVDAVDIPVIAAGGFFDGRGLVAALAYGAQGVAMGTRFLLTRESPVPDNVKTAYLKAGVGDTVATDQVDGHQHRMIRNSFVDKLLTTPAWKNLPLAVANALKLKSLTGIPFTDMLKQGWSMKKDHGYGWLQVVMAANTPVLLRTTMVEGKTEFGIMPGGQVMGLIDKVESCEELVRNIVTQANGVLEGFARG
ncbi:MAG: nitronate monooxygenase [Proteobacteria bacterium]|nr:nitronate monooxygenase [Pseudomonadota bacterium]HQR04116.1 nitronate monooxygenase [Rhodocyclaceae bacterium]